MRQTVAPTGEAERVSIGSLVANRRGWKRLRYLVNSILKLGQTVAHSGG